MIFILCNQCLVPSLLKIILPRRDYIDSERKVYIYISLFP